MDFIFSAEQEQLREAARAVLDEFCKPGRIRQAISAPRPFDGVLWDQIARLGWLGILAEKEEGGLVEASIVLEELGRALAPVPYLPTLLAVRALEQAGQHDVAEELCSGRQTGAAVWRDQLAVGDPEAHVAVRVTSWTVSLMQPAKFCAEPSMDRTRSVAWISDDGRTVGDRDDADDLLGRGAVGTAAMLLGGAQRVLEMSTEYALTRQQFGRPIASFQAVKHHAANMLVDVEAMRSLVYWAAWCIDQNHSDAPIAASAAKAWCADAGPRVIATGLQIHGGIGFTWEHDLHLFIKRANLDQVTFGAAKYHRDRLSQLLRDRLRKTGQLAERS
jgi:alkylation response protein AidB-like acyl-CoA dehydrogenase